MLRTVRHCATRFASWVYVVERISKLKRALRVVIDDAVYKKHCLKKQGRDDDPDDKEPSKIINDSAFWDAVEKFLEVMVPARVFLRYTDTRFSLACRVYEKFSDLQAKVEALELGAGFTEDDRNTVISSICGRWNNVHHPVHAAGYALDPENIMCDVPSDGEVWAGFVEVLDRLLTAEEKMAALLEWARYKKFDGISPEVLKLTSKMPPLDFWRTFLGHFPVLLKVALRVLDLRAGTRCVESHFSVMGAVHSKGRNRMVNGKVRKLTAVVTNTKMLDAAGKPGFGQEEADKGDDSDQEESDDDYVSDTDDEMDLEKLEQEEA